MWKELSGVYNAAIYGNLVDNILLFIVLMECAKCVILYMYVYVVIVVVGTWRSVDNDKTDYTFETLRYI